MAVKHFGIEYNSAETTIDYPTWCYLYGSPGHDGYFNKHLSGTGNENARAICKNGIIKHFTRERNKLKNKVFIFSIL